MLICRTGARFDGRVWHARNPSPMIRRDDQATKEDAMMTPAGTRDVISFGPFRLVASERLLTKDGAPVELGARALDILIALLSRPNEVVSKQDLLAQVWPDVTVEEGSLRFHIASLRKALGDGKDGARYITTLAGRGYCFVAPISRSSDRGSAKRRSPAADFPHANLPSRLTRMVGRDDDVLTLSAQLTAARFVTIVGAGGVGKTTVAVAVGHRSDRGLRGRRAVRRSRNAERSRAGGHGRRLHAGAVGSVRRCDAQPDRLSARQADSPDPRYLRASHRGGGGAGGTHLRGRTARPHPGDKPRGAAGRGRARLQTGRRWPVRRTIRGSRRRLLRRSPRPSCSWSARWRAAPAWTSATPKPPSWRASAESSTVWRSRSSWRPDASRPTACSRPPRLLDQRLTLLWLGPRTAPPRQKTLQATLDWSYGLLSELERVVLRRLAVFVGHFTLDAALAVVTSATVDQALVFGAIDSLVAKSMVATRPIGAMMRYRLLDTTRAYALEISIDDAELADLAARHATYYRRWLEQTGAEWPTLSNADGAGAPLCRAQQCPRGAGMVLRRQRQCRHRRRTCRRRRAGFPGDVSADGMSSLVGARDPRSRRCHARRARGDASSGGAGRVVDVHARQQRSGARGLGPKPRDRRGTRRRARPTAAAGPAAHVPPPHRAISKPPCTMQGAAPPSPEPSQDPAAIALAHSPLGESRSTSSAISAAPARSWRRRCSAGRALSGPARSISASSTTIMPASPWPGPCGCRAIRLRPWNAHARPSRTPQRMDHPVTLSIALIWAVSVFLWTGDLEQRRRAHGSAHRPCRIPFPGALSRGRTRLQG